MPTDDDLLALFPPGSARDADGGLRVAGCRLDELAEVYGTPLMVVDEAALRATVRAWRTSLTARLPRARITFASKAFPCTAVYRLMAEEGVGVDVAGGGELALALRGGVDTARCVLHGNAKSDAEIASAHEAGVGLIIVDNLDDLDRLERIVTREQGVLVRITPGVEGETHAAISTGGLDAKFGLPVDQAAAAIQRAAAHPLLRVDGVHVHIGSQIIGGGAVRGFRASAGGPARDGRARAVRRLRPRRRPRRPLHVRRPAGVARVVPRRAVGRRPRAPAARRRGDPRARPRARCRERRDRLPGGDAQAHGPGVRGRRRRHGRQPRGGAVRAAVRGGARRPAARARRRRRATSSAATASRATCWWPASSCPTRPSATCSPCR